MLDDLQETEYDESFWADVDALRAMLDGEEIQDSEIPEPAPMQTRTPAEPQLNLDFQPSRSSRPAAPAAGRNVRWEEPGLQPNAHHSSRAGDNRRSRPYESSRRRPCDPYASAGRGRPRRPSVALLVFLYLVILLELGGISWIGWSWYSWIH